MMQGFDPKWRDFPHYILGVTREIWEERKVDSLRRTYGDAIPVRSPDGLVIGNEAVIAATLATLAEFPDRELLGEDVIWSGSPRDGMLSSHRLLCTATHSGAGTYGPATDTRLTYRVIADCFAIANQITDEWLVRDQGAIVRQLGWEPKAFAADQVAREGGPARAARPFTPDQDVAGPYQGRGNDNVWGARYAEILTGLMDADMALVRQRYDRAVHLCLPGFQDGHGWQAVERFWIGLRASFPQADFTIDHQIGRGDDTAMPPRAAIRWHLHGRHAGWGCFGAPTGAEVHVMGACHAEFGPWGVRREYVLYDEVAIWKQIALRP